MPEQLPEVTKLSGTDSSIPQSNNQLENMEVHHHPNVEKKGFKEYFLEFLMIFLAVTMGFFAENIREKFNDKENMHQLTNLLVNDLKIDTARLSLLLDKSNLKIRQLDSLYALLQQPKNKINNLDLQILVVKATLNFNFVPSSGTINELKSTGVLRLFSTTRVPKLINSYESIINTTKIVADVEAGYGRKYIEEGFISKHFSPENIFKSADTGYIQSHSIIPVNGNLRNISQDDLVQFSVDLVLYKMYAMFLKEYYIKDL
jgi:hypothetical protein